MCIWIKFIRISTTWYLVQGTGVYMCIYVCIYIYIYTYTLCVYVKMYWNLDNVISCSRHRCIYVYICVYMYFFTLIQCVYMYISIGISTIWCLVQGAGVHMCICVYVYTHTTCIYVCFYTYTHKRVWTVHGSDSHIYTRIESHRELLVYQMCVWDGYD